MLESNPSFKTAFAVGFGFYFGEFVAGLLGLLSIGGLIAIGFLIASAL